MKEKILFTFHHSHLVDTLLSKTKFTKGEIETTHFEDGELLVKTSSDVKNKECVIIESFSGDDTGTLFKVLLLVSALRMSDAKSIKLVIPYLGYSRQGTNKAGEPNSSRVIASILNSAPIDEILTCDIHNIDAIKYYRTPVTNLYLSEVFAPSVKEYLDAHGEALSDVVIVSPDRGGKDRALSFKEEIGAPKCIALEKKRDEADSVEKIKLNDDVTGKTCIIVDDIISTGKTLCAATDLLLSKGAKDVIAIISHPVISKSCLERVKNSQISSVFIGNTIEKEIDPFFNVVDISDLICEAI
ncbi:MAG: ribose-phosphate diphosphokinase [Coprobacillus sp.]|nr:ribose-phosphate diphosphokinase [Coprobacillus sp.]